MSSKMMTHTDYSNWVILSEIEKGDYKRISHAFKRIAVELLNCREAQVASQYYKLKNNGITSEDVADYTEEDKQNFDPGDGDKIVRSYKAERTRSTSPEGYGEPWKSHQRGEGMSGHYDEDTDTIINLINPMRTILVIYTNTEVAQSSIGNIKKYAFNSESDVKVGDHINTPSYTTKLQVVAVLDKAYKYYNSVTGELSDTFNSTSQWLVKTLTLRDEENEVVYGTVVNKDRWDRPE